MIPYLPSSSYYVWKVAIALSQRQIVIVPFMGVLCVGEAQN